MSEPPRDYKKLYQDLMRNAGSRMMRLNRRALEREKAFRENARRRQAQRDTEVLGDRAIFSRILRREIDRLAQLLTETASVDERIYLKSEIAEFRRRLDELKGNRRRKPPESGLSVPVVPPTGPVPTQGGAAAPLEFDD